MSRCLVAIAGILVSSSAPAAEPRSSFREALRPGGDVDGDGMADFSTAPEPRSLTVSNETWWYRKDSRRPYGKLNADSRESTFQWDRNGDGRVDREETTRGGFVRRREDRDFDGVFEEIEETHPYEGGRNLLVRFRFDPGSDRYVLISAIPVAGSFNAPDAAPPLGIPREGADLPVCVPQSVLDELRAIPELARFYTTGVVREIPVVNVDGTLYWQVNGIRIPADCPNASDILTNYERGIGQGLACLRQMNGTLPAEAFSKLQALVSRPSPDQWVQVRCLPPDQMVAAASASMPPQPPVLTVRTEYEANQNVPATYFHEYLHLAGYPHAEGYEMSMTCEACCFGVSAKGSNAIAPGCDLCNTSNPDPYSQAHVEQLSQFYETVGETFYQRNLLLNFVAHSPGSRWGRIALLRAPAFPSSMRRAYALRLLTRTDLTAADRAILTRLAATTAPTGPVGEFSQRMTNVTEDVFAGIQGGTSSSAWDAALTSVEQSFNRLPATWTGERADHLHGEMVIYRGQLIDQLQSHLQGRMIEVIRSVPAWRNYDISQIHDLVTRAIPRHPADTPFGDSTEQDQAAGQIRALLARETEVRTRLSGPQSQEYQSVLAIPDPDAARPAPPPDPRGG